ncbi:XRE family transcriptional regulator [Streptomyces roseirectus]|uniref:XRE family transcriptional regulator n=2 Tax=Streptomyces roseirectus TaxID=2768066 RepID=A0A7H0ISE4_9ACTN|nr:XRE family transcriptional regulator [Streptomyces roseirectus]
MGLAFSAVSTVASGALSGAGGEAGRRISERLYSLLGRARPEAGATLPVTESERADAARDLLELSGNSQELADEVAEWLREASWLARRTAPTAPARPRMLPPSTSVFTDREDVVEWIEALPDEGDGPFVGVLTGPGGIGKTAVAVRGGSRLRERFPDGDLFVDLAGDSAATALTPSDVLARFLEALGVAPDRIPGDEARQRDLYRTLTADRGLLVVLDNAHDDAQVMPLIPASPTSLTLVTSRHRLTRLTAHHGARPRTLTPLSTEDAMLLLTRTVGRAAPEAAVRAVAEGTGGYPLAVCTTGAGLAEREHLSWERVARELRQDAGGSPVTDDPVRLAHDVSYAELAPDAAAFYRALGSWSWPALTVPLAAQAAGVDESAARSLLELLARVHLLEEVAEERYRFHDAARAHARELALTEDGHGRVAAAVRRVAVATLKSTARADHQVMPLRWRVGPAYRNLREQPQPGDAKRALEELSRERENTAAVIRAAAHHGFDDLVWQLCEAMWSLHLRLGFHAQWIDTHLLGAEAARRQAAEFGDPRAVGRVLVQLAFAYMGVGRADDASDALAEAVAADRACGHLRGEASAVETAGLLQLRLWNWREAGRRFQEARGIWERVADGDDGWADKARAVALLDLHTGRAESGAGEFDAALGRLNGALVGFRSLGPLGDRYNEGRVYMCLGELHLNAGDLEQALVCLDNAVAVMTAEGAGVQLADAVEVRAGVYRRGGRRGEEAADLRVAEEWYLRLGDLAGAGRVQERLGELGE